MDWDSKVRNNTQANRFEIEHEGHQAVAEYSLGGGVITFTHTFVPPQMRGEGIADALARVALATARKEGLRVIPSCSFFARYMERHAENSDLLA